MGFRDRMGNEWESEEQRDAWDWLGPRIHRIEVLRPSTNMHMEFLRIHAIHEVNLAHSLFAVHAGLDDGSTAIIFGRDEDVEDV